MIKNILLENMRRFKTKNLDESIDGLEEGYLDIVKLGLYKSEFQTILTPEQDETVINSTINSMIRNMGGPEKAANLMRGALNSVDSIKGLLKRLIPDDAEPLNVTVLNSIVDKLPFDINDKEHLKKNVMQLAQDLGLKAV
tara:strand:- start:777 stop:1196 length:420 start_codon:yes stop_codon:yes gene_type:complete